MTMPTPETLLPGPEGLAWLVYESPTFLLVFDQREGMAYPEDLSRLLWPTTDPHCLMRDLGWETPVRYICSLLDEQIGDRIGGVMKRKDRYCVMRPPGKRPSWLPRWPDSPATVTTEERPR